MENKNWREKFDRLFPCIQYGCDNNGVVAEQISDNEWEPQQCQYCSEKRLPLIELIFQIELEAKKEGLEMAIDIIRSTVRVNSSMEYQLNLRDSIQLIDQAILNLNQK